MIAPHGITTIYMTAPIASIEALEALYWHGENRALVDLDVIDRHGDEWTIIADEYDMLAITNDDETITVRPAEYDGYPAPWGAAVGAWETHGPFRVKGA